MNTNQFFSFHRFALLIKSDLLINYKKYLLTLLAVTAIGYIFIYLNLPKYANASYRIESYLGPFTVSLFALAGYVGSAFPAFNSKTERRVYLSAPASTFEKYTAQFLGRIIIAAIIFLIVFWVDANLARFTILNAYADKHLAIAPFSYGEFWKNLSEPNNNNGWLPLLMIFTIGFFMLTIRLFFNKHGLIKSIIALFVVVFLLMCLLALFSHLFFPETVGYSLHIPIYEIKKGWDNGEVYFSALGTVSCLTLLVLGYYKLKEKKL